MPQINFEISKHKLPAIIEKQARCFTPKKNEHDDWRVEQLRKAIAWIQAAVFESEKCAKSCDEAFQALPGGRTFSQLWKDPQIWISFLRTPDVKTFGQSVQHGRDLAIAYGSFRHGWKMVAATLIHELAHLNGATAQTTDAEDTLLSCGLADRHREEIIGSLRAIPRNAISFA